MMKSTIKSGLSGQDPAKSLSNWEQSQKSDQQKKMSQTGVINSRAKGGLPPMQFNGTEED